jgi:probable F420-dependent oxidoreductase
MTTAIRKMDELRFQGVSFSDHVAVPIEDGASPIGDSWPDALIYAAYVAGQTTRLRLFFYALVVPLRNPVTLAKQIATLDQLSAGRTTFALASGWLEEEFSAVGVPFDDRGARLDEYVMAMKALWTQESPTFNGKYVSLSNVVFEPKCYQRPHPPLLIGGSGRRPLERVLTLGDGWAPMSGSLEDLERDIRVLKESAATRGVSSSRWRFMFSAQLDQGDSAVSRAFKHVGDQQMTTAGSGDRTYEAVKLLTSFQEIGITDLLVVFGWDSPATYMNQLEWLANDVMPLVDGRQ